MLKGLLPLLLLLLGLFTFVDGLLVKNGVRPVFVFSIGELDDGGSKILGGLGYTVIEYNRITKTELGHGDSNIYHLTGYRLNHWFLPIRLKVTDTQVKEQRRTE